MALAALGTASAVALGPPRRLPRRHRTRHPAGGGRDGTGGRRAGEPEDGSAGIADDSAGRVGGGSGSDD